MRAVNSLKLVGFSKNAAEVFDKQGAMGVAYDLSLIHILTVTQTVPSGATFVTRSAPDGTVMEESGTGQRHIIYAIDLDVYKRQIQNSSKPLFPLLPRAMWLPTMC